MNLKDTRRALLEFWNEFRKDTSGLIGLGILALFVLVVIFEPVILPWKDVNRKWRNIDYWIDNSPAAPPAWTNLFAAEKKAVTTQLRAPGKAESDMDGGVGKILTLTFPYRFTADKAPLDLIFRATITGDVPMTFSVQRPDGTGIELVSHFEPGLANQGIRVTLNNEANATTFAFVKDYVSEADLSSLNSGSLEPVTLIFAKGEPTMASKPMALKGDYKLIVKAMLIDPATAVIADPHFVVSGAVSGVLGTDDMKRDIFSGLVAGIKWALLIGLMTSAISVFVGVLYGITSAYYGGVVQVIWRGNVHRIDLALLAVEELAPVLVNADIGMPRFEFRDAVQVHFRDSDELHEGVAADRLDVSPRHARRAEAGMTQRAAGRRGAQVSHKGGGDEGGGA